MGRVPQILQGKLRPFGHPNSTRERLAPPVKAMEKVSWIPWIGAIGDGS